MDGIDETQANTTRSSCDFCRRMKIKCEWEAGSCKPCATRDLECTVTTRQRKKPTVKRTEYIAAIEDRIRRMEAVINAAGLAAKLEEPEPKSIVDEIDGQAEFSNRMSAMMIGEEGASQFIGGSSTFLLFSPRGLRWIKEKTRNYDTDPLFRAIKEGYQPWDDFSAHYWRSRPDVEQTPFPTKDVADEYVNAYFQLFNPIFPVYEESRFRRLYDQHYSVNSPTSDAWYASLNVVLALGSAIVRKGSMTERRRSVIEFDLTTDISWMYFRNASSKLTDLLFKIGDIMALQAIICMCFMLQVIPNPQPAYMLVAAAVRLSHTLGLHRNLDELDFDALSKKERQNVFWVTYLMEVGVSSRSGRPPAMSDQDIAVSLPQTVPTGFDHFRWMVTLSLLESRVYSELYSAKAATKSSLDRLKSVSRLDTELTRWRDALPIGYRPESEVVCLDHEFTPVIMMHFGYYNCLAAIHRASIHHGSWTSAPDSESSPGDHDGEKLNPRVYISSFLCLQAARNVISLLQHYNRDFPRDSLILMATYYPLTATLTLFSNILQNPGSSEAFTDIDLMGEVTAFLSRSTKLQRHLGGIVRVFAELNYIAGQVVRDAQMTQLNELKRKFEETSNANYQDDSNTTSQEHSAQYFAAENGGDNAIQPTATYPYSSPLPYEQSLIFGTSESSMDFLSELTDTWTAPFSDGFAAEMHMW